MDNQEDAKCYAYALGYYDGRVTGNEVNPFPDGIFRHAYTAGYERGVTDYCAEAHSEDPEEPEEE